MNIFQIDEAILSCVDMETGEVIDFDRLSQLQMERDQKVENVGIWYKDCLAQAEAIQNEIKRLADRKNALKAKADSLKKYLEMACDGQPFETAKISIKYRKSESVDIFDISKIAEKYLKHKAPEPDKVAIKKAIKAGEDVDGAILVQNQNIQIK